MKSKHFSAKFIKLKLLVVLLDTSLIYFWGELGLSYTSGVHFWSKSGRRPRTIPGLVLLHLSFLDTWELI